MINAMNDGLAGSARTVRNDLLIRQKCEAMIEYGHSAVRQFPKMERHVLGAEIRATMWALLRLIVGMRAVNPC